MPFYSGHCRRESYGVAFESCVSVLSVRYCYFIPDPWSPSLSYVLCPHCALHLSYNRSRVARAFDCA